MAAVYSRDQIASYFDYVELPSKKRAITPKEAKTAVGLIFLRRLQRHQLTHVPWENLSLHYNPNPTPVLALTDPQDIYEKIVGTGFKSGAKRSGRGGVCFENNIFFGTILRSLGYDVYSVGARVCHGPVFTTWTHMVNIVTIEGIRYTVDVGFGGRGQIGPVPLVEKQPRDNISPAECQFVKKALAEQVNQEQKLWVYQWRPNPRAEWEDKWAITEAEYLPVDFEAMAVLISFKRNSIFSHSLMMAKMISNSELWRGDSEEIVGELTLVNDRMRRYIRGREDAHEVMKTESDRMKVLDRWFGIKLSAQERKGIKETAIELG